MRIKSRSKSNCLIDIYNFQTTVEGNADAFNGELKKLTAVSYTHLTLPTTSRV